MKISVVLHHVHRGQLPHVSPGSWKTEFVYMCVQKCQYSSIPLFFVSCFVTSVGGRGKLFIWLGWTLWLRSRLLGLSASCCTIA